MKNTKIKALLLLSLLAPYYAITTDISQAEVSQHNGEIDHDANIDNNNDGDTAKTPVRKKKKLKKFCKVRAKCLSVSGNLTVGGTLTANGPLVVNDGATINGLVTINGSTFPLSYGYVYNLSEETLSTPGPITFDSNGPIYGITHTPGSSVITVANTGVYTVLWSATNIYPPSSPASACAIFINGNLNPSTLYISAYDAIGLAILNLNAGDQIQLITFTGIEASPFTVVNAALLIQQIG
jgi:hypothetical protein